MKIFHWIASVAAILVAAYIVPGITTTLIGAIILSIVLGIINIFFKPILQILTLPLNVVTLGLFSFVLNALLVLLAAQIVPGFVVTGFLAALLFSIVVSLVNAFFELFV